MTRFYKLRVGREVIPLAFTCSLTVDAVAGSDPSIVLKSNTPGVVYGIVSGSANMQIIDAVLSLISDVAGTYNCTVRMTELETGRTLDASFTFTITGSVSLAQVTGVARVSRTTTSVTLSWNAVPGATKYQVDVNAANNWRDLSTTTQGTVGVLLPGTAFDFRIRATDGSTFGPPSAVFTDSTLDDVVVPPDPNFVPKRAIEFSDGQMLQMYLTRRSGDPYMAYRTANGANTGSYDTSGWYLGHFAPLASVGMKLVRSTCGCPDNSTNMTAQIIQKMYDDYGVRINGTLTDLNQFSGTAIGAETIIERCYNYYKEAMNAFAGLNEPNNPDEPMYDPRPGSPDGWRGYVIDHQYVICHEIRNMTKYPNWPTDLTIGSWSPWSRLIQKIRSVLYEGYVHTTARANQAGVMYYDTFQPYTNPNGRQWTRDVVPLVDWPNLHLYTGGNMPDVAGETDGLLDEGGSNDVTIHITKLMAQYKELVNLDPAKKVKITEEGWELGGTDGRSFTVRFLTEEARCKYYQRSMFDYQWWGITGFNAFEMIDNAHERPNLPTSPGKVYGLLAFSQAGGVYTFTRRMLWYIMYLTLKAMWDGAGTARTFNKTNLEYSFSDGGTVGQYDGTIRWQLYQRSDGKWLLPVWRNSESWKRTAPVGNSFTSRNIRLNLPTSKPVRYTRPYTRAALSQETLAWTTAGGGGNVSQVDFTCHDDVTIFEIG